MNVAGVHGTHGGGEVQPSTHVNARLWLVWAMGLNAVAYAGALALHGIGFELVVDVPLMLLTVWLPVVVCWLAVSRAGRRRWDVLLPAAAVTTYAAGRTYYSVSLAAGLPLPFPSPATVGTLLFYALMVAALAATVRRRVQGLASSMWWDCLVGSLGAAALLAVLLSPVLDSAIAKPFSLATTIAVAYPMFDLLLVASVVGIAALRGVRMGSRWGLLVVALLIFAAGHVIFALQVSRNAYVPGTPLDAGWAVGIALIALWVDGSAQGDRSPRHLKTSKMNRATVMAVPLTASMAALGVLIMDTRRPESPLAQSLAVATLLVAVVQARMMYGQLARMADLRQYEATNDSLTGLPNRRALYSEAQELLADQSGRRALLLLDLDKFKEVNDTLGHLAGDRLLVEVGTRLREQMRGGDLVARLGGDEFAVLLEDVGRDEALTVAGKLCEALAQPFTTRTEPFTTQVAELTTPAERFMTPIEPSGLGDLTLRTSASIGIALFPDDGTDLSALLRKADIAMYKAKIFGNGHHLYSGTDDADDATRLAVVEELRTAMTSDPQLVLHYQPKIDLGTGEVQSVEALVRWEHPTRGLVGPEDFVALAEEAGLTRTMTRLILEMALEQAAAWQAQGQNLTVAVNLSASSLVDDSFPDEVVAMLEARGVPPRALQLEITEEFLMINRDRARNILTRLRDSGIQIAVDDFGTGYSSLGYLSDLPIDELKLDRSFVFPMAGNARAAAFVASTIDLSHSMGLRMVAEGVESGVAYSQLARLGCDQAQGDFMSQPVPAAELDQWLANRSDLNQPADTPAPLTPAATSQGTAGMTGADWPDPPSWRLEEDPM